MNFFAWIREGVRQAVLLGVSDAVETIGPPPNETDMGQHLLEVIRKGGPDTTPKAIGGSASPKRKKLGRSLSEVQASAAKAS